jgi:phenylacetate-CoA ligase
MRLNDALRIGLATAGLQRSQWRSEADIRASQQARLGQILTFALQRVPYYQRLGVSTRDGRPADWLARLPVLTKRDLQLAGDDLLAEGISKDRLQSSRTSGSTGEPTVAYFDRSTWLLTRYALKLRRMLSYRLGPGTRVLIVSEADETRLQSQRGAVLAGEGRFFRQAYLSLHTPLENHVRELQGLRPHAIYAFPSYLSDLLDYCEYRGLVLPPVKVVFTSSEIMPAALRRRLTEKLGARVCDIYGCTEFKEIAWQCDAGCYHVNHESVWIESLPGAETGGPGTLLLTTLVNRAAPLIRYRVGDLGRLEWTRCSCGREGPALSELVGREVELLELPGGRRLSPYLLTTAVEDAAGLRQYQFVQTAADCLELRFSTVNGYPPDRALLQARLHALLGKNVQVQLKEVAAIPRTSGGKRKVFVRDLGVRGAR